jgi:hypothetical protein
MNRKELQTELAALKARISEIEAQMAEPEWVPFPGEIVEGRDSDGDEWVVGRFVECNPENAFPWDCGVESWVNIRPLSDPNVIQLRRHTPGDPMPCDGNTRVLYRLRDGMLRMMGHAEDIDWSANGYGVTAWAPIPRVPL